MAAFMFASSVRNTAGRLESYCRDYNYYEGLQIAKNLKGECETIMNKLR